MPAKALLWLWIFALCGGCIEDRRARDPAERGDEDGGADARAGDLSDLGSGGADDGGQGRADGGGDGGRVDEGLVDAALGDGGAGDGGAGDGGAGDGGAGDAELSDAGSLDGGLSDAEISDAEISDAGAPDAEISDAEAPDAGQPDAESPDAEIADMALDDLGVLDEGLPDLGVAPEGFIIGVAQAIDGVTPTIVDAGAVSAAVGEGGRFELGPLEPGVITVTARAEGHQAESVEVEVPEEGGVALPAPLVLYRGVRITAGVADRLLVSGDERWITWPEGGALWTSALEAPEPRLLLEDGYEVYLGYAPDNDAVVIRVRTEPGVAGDIWWLPVDGGLPRRLFQRAQPWVRWIGARILAMVDTAEALSTLVSNTREGDALIPLADGVPWLLISQMFDNRIAWAQAREGGGFDVALASTTGDDPTLLTDDESLSNGLILLTTSGRRGLLWVDLDGRLWRWTGEGAPVAIAEDVLSAPRPTGLGVLQALYWRQGPEAGAGDYLFYDGDQERLIGADLQLGQIRSLGRDVYGVGADGRWMFGDLDGVEMAPLLDGEVSEQLVSGAGAVALIEGEVWQHQPGGGLQGLGAIGGARLRTAAVGLTTYDAESSALWWLPAPGAPGEVAQIAESVARDVRIQPLGDQALITQRGDEMVKIPLPPGAGPEVIFDGPLDRLIPTAPGAAVGYESGGLLLGLDTETGAGLPWADGVREAQLSPRRGYVIYQCDRGVFAVPLAP